MRMAQKDTLDRFYTQADVVDACLSHLTDEVGIKFERFSTIVEPSAGSGAFSSKLPEGSFAFDVAPAVGATGIATKDWLAITREDLNRADGEDGGDFLVIGNPPFGIRSSVAKRFITHGVSLGATTIAFVLPDVFSKMSNQRCFPDGWRLVSVLGLRREAFTIDGQPYHVPCSFFVWTTSPDVMPGTDLREAPVPQPKAFSYLGRGDERADFAVNGNSGRVRDVREITNPKAEHYVRVSDGYDVAEVRQRLANLDLDFRSSANGGVAWVNRDDINRAWHAMYGDE